MKHMQSSKGDEYSNLTTNSYSILTNQRTVLKPHASIFTLQNLNGLISIRGQKTILMDGNPSSLHL